MKTIEEEIWEYLDGVCSIQQNLDTEAKIASDPLYRSTYEELKQLQDLLLQGEAEEPSMSFTRNVMEQVQLEIAPVSMKTKVDQRIIYGIAAIFALSLMTILGIALANLDFSRPEFIWPQVRLNVDLTRFVTPMVVKAFLFIDTVLGLMYLDRFLRRKISH